MITRRSIIGNIIIGGSFLLGGCSSTQTSPETDTPTMSNTPSENGHTAPAPSCHDEYIPLDPSWAVEGPGPLGGFDLTLERHQITHGDTLTATLKNVANEESETGNKKKYDIQYHAESGWHSIFGTEDEIQIFSDEAILHQPGEGFTWQLTFT